MSDHTSNSSGGEKSGLGTLGWVLIVIAAIIVLPYLIAFVLGVAGVALTAAWGAVGAILGALGAAFGIIMGLLGALLGIFASMSVVLFLLLPGIIIGLLLGRAMSRRRAE